MQFSKIKLLNDCIYFDIVIRGLCEAFEELNIKHEIVETVDQDDQDLYLVCVTHHLHQQMPLNYISYNFEQLITDKKLSPQFFDRLRNAKQVWDYSLENIKVLEKNEVKNVVHIPFGYFRGMDVENNSSEWKEKPFDWSFVGSVNDNRAYKLGALIQQYFNSATTKAKCLITNSCWGKSLDRMYANTKIGINVHFYTGKTILEVHRIVPMIANGVWVVSERSDDPWYDDAYKSMVTYLPNGFKPPQLAACVDLISNKMDIQTIKNELDKRRKILIEQHSYVKYLSNKRTDLII